jgi:hypothetical protein
MSLEKMAPISKITQIRYRYDAELMRFASEMSIYVMQKQEV